MKRFILLVLGVFCFQARAHSIQELDCDDPKVFKAVDIALQIFNDKRDGNQFALLQVLEARELDLVRTTLRVKYRLRETVCAVGEGRWQECEFKNDSESGNCMAQISHQPDNEYSSVSQTCVILRAPERVFTTTALCLGCWFPLSNDSISLLPIVRYNIRQFNNQSDHPYLFEVGEILHAQRQVVSGMNYKFVYSIKETNCSKAEFSDLTPECKPIPGGRLGECEVLAYVNISGVLVYATQDCKYIDPFPLHCFGCEQKISDNDKDMRKALDIAIDKFNNESGDSVYYELKDIMSATTQLVAGINYRIACSLVKTNCTLEQHLSHQYCEPVKPLKLLTCRISIYVIPWRNLTYPKITCTKFMHPVPDSLRDIDYFAVSSNQRYIAGLTPFRKARHAPRDHVNHGHKKPKHGHRSSREEKINQEETLHLADTESPEQPTTVPQEDPTIDTNGPPVRLPDVPLPDDNEGSPDSPLFESLPDLPEPTCPGKIWKPLKVSTTPAEERASPTHRPLEDFDLLDALQVQK